MTRTFKEKEASYYFHQGTNTKTYEYLGAHREKDKFFFRVWAPNAESVSVVGDFNFWDTSSLKMERITEKGIWEAVCDSNEIREFQKYKFFIVGSGKEVYKADPYAFFSERPPKTASVIYTLPDYNWTDSGYIKYRKSKYTRENVMSSPLNIYEVHPASFMRHDDNSYLTYRELAEELSTYVKQMGYTHVELMPIMEYPFDASWGYQVCGYFAPTSRFGSPEDFMYFVNKMHEAGIGVILDWVPAHFPKDEHGLFEFDNRPLYEYQGKDRIEHEIWGTRRFDVGREEVQSFLISSANYWIEKFHVDGLRVDAVASMLYLDYDKKPGEWVPNVYGDNRCLEAIAFFKKFNSLLQRDHPDVMTIAEESTAFSNITGFENDGLGFTMKWNMGWMNDTLSYATEDPFFRSHHHNKINFSLSYAFSENYLLPISHDEVVHGKKSFLDKMPGSYEEKFASARAFLSYMMTHPGKKLLFMSSEIGQFREWDFAGEVEWFLTDYEMHSKLQEFVCSLNHFYLENPCLWEIDGGWEGFDWIDADNAKQSIASYRRIDKKGRELTVIINFTPVKREDFLLAVSTEGSYREVFNSDDEKFGGGGVLNEGILKTEPCMLRGYSRAIKITLPPLSALVFKCVRKKKTKK
ncbi:MAG: 1,4-alpha-glucan branching protein GlgB [Ruminococcaceae bacterium]|nr:1,4-alpha-glucan branching protein GlgB [Oscillospiraceae bacterium]